MAEKEEFVTVPRKAIELILDRGCFQDEGPDGEGWASPDLRAAIDQIKAAMGAEVETKNPTG